jgi:transposase, IS5 family
LEAIAVLRTKVDAQGTLWETLLPPEFLRLPPGLSQVDRLLDDPVFYEPFEEFFDPEIGRPSIPMETYLRMMFLRFRYRLGFETLCVEVADSLAWRRFCRIGLTDSVPHPTTLMKITTRCGSRVVAQLNGALLVKADAAKVVKLDKVRADTTVVEANVSYPSDAGLLGKGVAKITKLVGKLKDAGYGQRTRFRDRRRSVAKRSHAIAAWLKRRGDDKKDEVLAITAELVAIARASVKEAQVMAENTRRSLRRAGEGATGRSKALVSELEETVTVLSQVIAQTRLRLKGGMPQGSTRVVSLHDADARPIAKGRLGRPVEFGFKAQVLDNKDGIVLDHEVISVHDATGLMLRAEKTGWGLVALDVAVDTTTPQGAAMAQVLAVFAELERRLIGERTKAALAVKRAQGVRLGRERQLPDAVRKRILARYRQGAGWSEIAQELNDRGVPTAQGGRQWHPATVRYVVIGNERANE